MRLVFASLGMISVMAQVMLMRRLMSVFSGNELTIGAALAGWMIWTGLGSAVLARSSDRLARPRETLAVVFFLSALLLPATMLLTYTIKPWLGYTHAEIVGVEVVILASFIITGPLCFALGFAFNLCCRMIEEISAAVGRVYLWEALGSCLGGAAFSFILAGRVSLFLQVHLLMAILFAAACLALPAGWLRKAFVLLVLLSLFGLVIPKDRGLGRIAEGLRWKDQNLLIVKESRYGELAVTESSGEVTFYTDGVPAFTHPLPEPAEYMVHLPLSMCENPRRILLIGGGLAEVASEIMKHQFERLDYVQIDPDLTVLEERFIPAMKGLLSDPRIHVYHEDGRMHLKLAGSGYDAVLLNLPAPETARLNRFYTVEFFELVKSRLNKGGVFGLTAGTSGNYLSQAQALLLGTISTSLDSVFDRVVILPLGVNYLVAGDEAALLSHDPERITASLRQKGIRTRFVREYFLQADLSDERLESVKARLDSVSDVFPNFDLKPSGYLLGLALWLEQAQPSYRGILELMMALPKISLVFIPLVLLLSGIPLAFRRRARASAVIAVLASGFLTMAMEVVVMIAFQVIHGYVYHLLGLIVASFMIGLAAGAWTWEQAAKMLKRRPRGLEQCFLGALAILTLIPLILIRVVPFLIRHQFSGTITFVILVSILFVLALASGFIFPAAAALFLSGSDRVGSAAGWINSADHLGAAFGALIISAFTIPLFGLDAALVLGFFVAASSLLISLVGLSGFFHKGN